MNENKTEPKPKTASESYTEQVHIVSQADLNGARRLFGGTLMSWIDEVAAIVARRHCGSNVVTVAVDNLTFLLPAYGNDMIVTIGKVTYTGNTSVEVCVKSYIEDNLGNRKTLNRSYLSLVALDENGNPIAVPQLIPQTDKEREDFELGRRRRVLRQQRQREKY